MCGCCCGLARRARSRRDVTARGASHIEQMRPCEVPPCCRNWLTVSHARIDVSTRYNAECERPSATAFRFCAARFGGALGAVLAAGSAVARSFLPDGVAADTTGDSGRDQLLRVARVQAAEPEHSAWTEVQAGGIPVGGIG